MASGAAAAPVVQTLVLKVAIHCHGCKKKVRKVLRSIEGVQDVTVDASQHKVTVTGTVDADTLIKRLYKSGKKGVPWQCHPPANKTEAAPEAPQPAGDGGKDAAAAAAAADKKPEEAVKEPQGESSEEKKKKPEQEVEAAEKKPEAESKEEEKKVEAKKDSGDSEGAETKQAKGAAEPAKEAAAASDEDEAKKSDKPKDAGEAEPAAVMTERSLPLAPAPKHAYEQEYRPPYYYAPQPVLSYHAAQRSSSVSYFAPQAQPAYSTQQAHPHQAYYSAQQPQPQPAKQWSPSYLYMPYPHAAPEPYYQDYYGPPGMHASPMHDSSYRIFDDENPNSCSVM